MYKTILLTLDGTRTDRAMIDHVKPLAKPRLHNPVAIAVGAETGDATQRPDG